MAGACVLQLPCAPMLLDAQLDGGVASAAPQAARAERTGFAGVWAAEVTRDPMLTLAAAAAATTDVTVGTNVVLAFTRNPMSVAMQAWELADATAGRFVLGLATQVKPHITRRFSMPWGDPVGRMREFVERPAPHLRGLPGRAPARLPRPLLLPHAAARDVQPRPDRASPHPDRPGRRRPQPHRPRRRARRRLPAPRLHQHRLPGQGHACRRCERGLAASGRTRADIWVFGYLMLVAGDTEEEQARAADRIRGQIAFYASSPMYREVLDCIGCAELQTDLQQLVKQGRWAEMPGLVDDDVLDHFVAAGHAGGAAGARIRARYGGYYDRAVPYVAARRRRPRPPGPVRGGRVFVAVVPLRRLLLADARTSCSLGPAPHGGASRDEPRSLCA